MVSKTQILQFFGRFFMYIILIGIIITSSVLVNQFVHGTYTDSSWNSIEPYQIPANTAGYNVILDQHSHTNYSDGEMTVRQSVLWHISMGYNACVITDHESLDNKDEVAAVAAEFAGTFALIQGMEWSTDRIHMNILGLTDWDFETFPIPDEPTDQEIQDAITEAHAQGAVVTCDHIPWSINQAGMTTHPTRQQLFDWGIDFIEVVNDDALPENVYDPESITWVAGKNIGLITGTDVHEPDYLAGGGVRGWTLINATTFTVSAIMDQLVDHNTTIVYSPAPYLDRGVYMIPIVKSFVDPISKFGEMFVLLWNDGLDWLGVSVFVVIFLGIFAMVEIYRVIRIKLWKFVDNKQTNETRSKQ
jgi:hypothetical protein